MTKKLMTDLAVALASTGTMVQADELVTTQPAPATESKTTTKPVTKADVAQAKDELDKATQAVSDQETVVKAAEADWSSADQTVLEATSEVARLEEVAKEATSEVFEKAKQEIATAEGEVISATEAISQAEADEVKAQQAVSDQDAIVAIAQADLDQKTEEVNQAQQAVDIAKAILDGTNQAQVIKEADEANVALDKANEALTTAQSNLTKAQEADQKRQEVIASDEVALTTAKATENNRKVEQDKVTAIAETTSQALIEAQATLTQAENAKNAINRIVLTDEYVAALKVYSDFDRPKAERDEAEATLKNVSQTLASSHRYQVNVSDDTTTTYDLNNLPLEVLTELSLFASDLMNQIRKQVGTAETVVTPSSIAFADKVTDKTIEANWSTLNQGHNEAGITAVAREYQLKGSDQESNYYENWIQLLNVSETSYTVPDLTLPQLKEKVYKVIVEMMFPSFIEEWLHAGDIAGTRSALVNAKEATKTSYVAVDVIRLANEAGLHIFHIDDVMVTGSENFDTRPIANPYDSAEILRVYDEAKATFDQAKATDTMAQTAKTTASQAYTEAKQARQNKEQALATAKAVPIQTPTAEATLAKAQATQATAKTRHTKAQEALANLSADVKTKRANLTKAKEILSKAQMAQVASSDTLTAEKANLADLKASHELATKATSQAKAQKAQAADSLTKAKKHLEELQNVPVLLEEAKTKLVEAKTVQKDKLEQLEKEIALLKELKATQADLATQHAKVLEAYKAYLKTQEVVNLANSYEAIVKEGGQPVPIVDEMGKVTGYVSETRPAPVKPVIGGVKPATKELPKTGDQRSGLLGLVGLMMSLFGLSLKQRKETNDV